MIKLTFCLRRLPHLGREEFQTYWRNTHGPLVRKHARSLGLKRYVQVHTLATPMNDALRQSRGGPEAFDGVAEIWFDDLTALESAVGDPGAQQALQELLEDERKFIDLARSPLWLSEEHEILA